MEINTPLEPKTLTFYDITFVNGLGIPIVIDESLGDTITLGDTKIVAYIAPRPSMSDPKDHLPAQNIVLYMAHIVGVQYYSKEIMPATPEQQFQYAETFKELTGKPTVH